MFLNLVIGIAILETAFLINYAYTSGNVYFFKVPINSVRQLNEFNTTIDKMGIFNAVSPYIDRTNYKFIS